MTRAGSSQERGGAGILACCGGGPPFLLCSIEIIISRRAAETIELCVEKVLIFISTEYRRKGDRDIATTSSIEMVNDIVRDGL